MQSNSDEINSIRDDNDIDDKDKFKTYKLKDSKFRNLFKSNVDPNEKSNKVKRDSKVIPKRSVDKRFVSPKLKHIIPSESNSIDFKETVQTEDKEQIEDEKVIVDFENNASNLDIKTHRSLLLQDYRSFLDCKASENTFPSFDEDIEKMDLANIPESESPIIIENNNDDCPRTMKIENNQLKYFLSKRKPTLEFSFEFLQSFANKNIALNRKDSKLNNIKVQSGINDYLDLSGLRGMTKNANHLTFKIYKNPRTKSLVEKRINDLSSKVMTNEDSSFFESSINSEKTAADIPFRKFEDNSDRTFTRRSLLQRLNDIKGEFDPPKSDITKPVILPRHLSENLGDNFINKDLRGRKNIISHHNSRLKHVMQYSDIELVHHNSTEEKLMDVLDDSTILDDLLNQDSDLASRSSNALTIVHENDELYNVNHIDQGADVKAQFSDVLIYKLRNPSTNLEHCNELVQGHVDETKTSAEVEPPRKHIYVELLAVIMPKLIDDSITKLKFSKLKPEKTPKKKTQKSKTKITKDNKESREVEYLANVLQNLENYFSNEIIDETSVVLSDDQASVDSRHKTASTINLKNINETNNDSKSYSRTLKATKKEEYLYVGQYAKRPKPDRNYDNVDLSSGERFNISWKNEAIIPDQIKQTILMYDAQIRKSVEEKNCLYKENFEIMELNNALQKRNGVLLTEFKQEKRETAFIKNQIAVMISRMQSIPEKLSQLEAENENLKSEISDLERTLEQRDQLFVSERQMNASLSEEIVKLESESVNKELMKSVCEEFENLNEEYEILKKTLEETEDKLFEIVQDRDNLIKHAKVMEEHLYKLKAENNYFVQNYQMLTPNSIMDGTNHGWSSENRDMGNYGQTFSKKSVVVEEKLPESRQSFNAGKGHYNRHHCDRTKHRSNSRSFHYSTSSNSSSSSSTYYSDSSSDYKRKHKKKRKHSHKHKHKKSHSHKHSHKKGRSRKEDTEEEGKESIANKNQNTNAIDPVNPLVIEMPKSREELKKLEMVYDDIQGKKSKLEALLSHIPTNKGISNSSNMTNMQEQETLEYDLDQCDKQLASLRKILKQCKVFKSIP